MYIKNQKPKTKNFEAAEDSRRIFGIWFLIFGFNRERFAFTIVELLVVVAIFGLLASIVLTQLSTARAKARDAEREQEIKTLQSALAIYATQTNLYPVTAGEGVCLDGTDAASTALVNAGTLAAVPRDPQHNCSSVYHYRYTAVSPGTTYVITYYLETDTIPGKSCPSPPCQQQASP